MSRITRKKRKDVILTAQCGVFDLMENTIKQEWCLNDLELDCLCQTLNERQLDLLISSNRTISESKEIMILIDEILIKTNY